jgi:predicted SnoaL-like aldol condensation-catalyzing enzyme
VNIVRVFEDGDFVFAHTEYDFDTRNIGFEIFRFEDNQAVEHWDNIQPRKGPNSSGNTMVDGLTEVTDLERTEYNREIILSFVNEVLIKRQFNKLNHYIKSNYIEHNPRIANGLSALQSALSMPASIQYNKNHRILAEGDFVLSVCEGTMNEVHSSFYDLYRIAEGKIVEHWDTTEKIPSQEEWKNKNGKF